MAPIRTFIAASAALVATTSLATAQQFVEPKFFSWIPHPAPCPAPGGGPCGWLPDPYLTSMAGADCMTFGNWPEQAARQAAQTLLNDLAAGHVSPGRICVLPLHFGHNHEYAPQNLSLTRFFRDEDRLAGLNDYVGILPSGPNWPRPRDDAGGSDLGTARAYRHPFLINAFSTQAPLRLWMERFVAEWRAMQHDPSHTPYTPGLPDPERVYFDTETVIASVGQVNDVFMLWHIAQNRPDLWYGWLVPGDPGGRTLAQIYDSVKGAYGWPAHICDFGGIDPSTEGDDRRNRPFMVWWAGIIQRAQDRLMQHSAYDVIHAAWPNCRVGNYGDSRSDGQADRTSWYWDRGPNDQSDLPYRYPSNMFVRSWIDPNPPGASMYNNPSGRFLAVAQWTSGDVDMPFLYKINNCQWRVRDPALGCADPREGHQQANLYLPPGGPNDCGQASDRPCETARATTLRLSRHACESTISSYGGGHEDRLTPWLEMVGAHGDPSPVGGYTSVMDAEDLRDMLAMLRSKNIREAAFWTNSEAPDPAGYAWAWNETSAAIRAVYAARVHAFTRLVGGGWDPGEDASSLEFTLRVYGADRTVTATAAPVGGTAMSDVQVEFRGLDWYPTNPPAGSGLAPQDYLVHVEASANAPDGDARVHAYDFASGQWVTLMTLENAQQPSYLCQAQTDGSGWYDNRRTLLLHASPWQQFVGGGHMYLRLTHQGTPPGPPLAIKYDLLQVIPIARSGSVSGDMDGDGQLTPADLARFVSAWLQGEALADYNHDGRIEPVDLAAYVNLLYSAWN